VTRTTARAKRRSPEPDEAGIELRLPKAPPDLVLRPRLFDLLDAGIADRALTLLSAPPGAGKTMLLTSWLQHRAPEARLAFLTVREADRAPFWKQLLDAVRTAIEQDTLLYELDAPGDDASPAFIERFVEAVSELDEPLVLVVDDLHLASQTALAALDSVLRAPPAQLRLVAASRIDPPLGLHMLRVTGDLAEIRARTLAFDSAEAQQLFQAMGLEVDERDVATVIRTTEGFAAALRLLGISLQQRGDGDVVERFTVDERPMMEFLAEEVLALQPEDVRLFLLRTSIVDTLDGELANELSGRADGERVLERLFHGNVFVERVPGDRHVYRYHQLFGALLRAEAAYEFGGELSELHERAASCLARRGHAVAAVQHGVDAGRWELVATLLADHWSAVLVPGEGTSHDRRLLETLPPKQATAFPVVAAFSALVRIVSADTRGAAALLSDADGARELVPEPARAGFDSLNRYAAALIARDRGNLVTAGKLAAEGLERSAVEATSAEIEDQRRALHLATLGAAQVWEGSASEARSTLEEAVDVARATDTPLAEVDALAHLALLELGAGHLRRADRIARAALDLERVHDCGGSAAAVAHVVVALVQHEWGDLEAAEHALADAGDRTRRAGNVPGRVLHAIAAGSIALSEDGDAAEEALLHLRAVRRRVGANAGEAFAGRIAALEARLLAKTGRLDEASEALGDPGSDAHAAVAAARIQLVLGSPSSAIQALALRRGAAPYVEIEARVTEAAAKHAVGESDLALTAVSEALALAEPEAVRRPFIDAGGAVRELLGAHLRRTNAHRWLAAELVAFLDGRDASEGVAPAELLEPLSDREREVLHYLPTIMSNADIAAELFVSVNTVKTHVKSIYRKLGAKRRHDAVRRARQLRLI
jgi:LuxR family maltose regulon positive regulatory protein